jgi:ABC-type xylose transport system substrate-binding protein
MKRMLIVIVALLMIFSLNAATKVIGISMPTKSSERWISDGIVWLNNLKLSATNAIFSMVKM